MPEILSITEIVTQLQQYTHYACTALLDIMLAICIYTDGKYGKIYNKVLLPCCIAGFVLNTIAYGINGLLSTCFSFAVALIFFSIFYKLHGIAAGDVKLIVTCAVLMNVFYAFGGIIVGSLFAAFYATYKWMQTGKSRIRIPYGVFVGIGFYVYQIAILLWD